MDKEYFDTLAKIRIGRAKELLDDATELLKKGSYKSANNRAFYAMEKGVKALLAMKNIIPLQWTVWVREPWDLNRRMFL